MKFWKLRKKNLCWNDFFDKVAGWRRPAILLTKTPTQVLCSELCETLKIKFFAKTSAHGFLFFLQDQSLYQNNDKQMWNGASQCKRGST